VPQGKPIYARRKHNTSQLIHGNKGPRLQPVIAKSFKRSVEEDNLQRSTFYSGALPLNFVLGKHQLLQRGSDRL
jgi:hypothetical protein